MKIQLHIIKNGQLQKVNLTRGETKVLTFDEQAQYQFFDENQQIIQNMRFEKQADDLAFWLPELEIEKPIVLFDDSDGFIAGIHMPQHIFTHSTAVQATEVGKYVGIAGLAVLGVGALAAMAGGGGSDDKPATTSTPTQPVTPTQPITPSTPVTPTQPSTPATPPPTPPKPTPQPEPKITFNPITSDNHISVNEKSQMLTISGALTGESATLQKGKEISLSLQNKTLKATVQDDLTFSFQVNGEDLLKQPNYQFSGSLNHQGKTVSAQHQYTVAPDAVAKIQVNDVAVSLADVAGAVRLSGKLNFHDSMLQYGYNKDVIQALVLHIGNQSFTLGVKPDDSTFFLDLTREQYDSLKGQTISHELKTGNFTVKNQNGNVIAHHYHEIKDGANGGKEIGWRDLRKDHEGIAEINKITLDFDDAHVQSSRQLQLPEPNLHTISGSVEGGKVGDIITLNIGSQSYQTTVQTGQQFTVQVKSQDLQAATSFQAALHTQNGKGENITVTDTGDIHKPFDVSGGLVIDKHELMNVENRIIQHSDPNYNFPYFIHANIPTNQAGFSGFLQNIQQGQPATIYYYFATKADYDNGLRWGGHDTEVVNNSYQNYSDEQKQIIRDIYKELQSVTNIQFIETSNRQEAHTTLMMADLIPREQNGQLFYVDGLTHYAGNVILRNHLTDTFTLVATHEILHTLDERHVADIFKTLDYAKYEDTTEVSHMADRNFALYSGRHSLSMYDIAYLHYRFGINPNHKTGNDVYSFQNYTSMTSEGNRYIWDAGGVDTFDASRETDNVYVNLTAGSWIYRGAISDTFLIKDHVQVNNWNEYAKYFPEFAHENLTGTLGAYSRNVYTEGQAFIGYGTQLENLIGSVHNDILLGNQADNNIAGNAGDDKISGDAGNDYLDGGKGNDRLDGGNGSDKLIGGEGADTFVFSTVLDGSSVDTIVDFDVTQDKIELALSVFSGLDSSNLAQRVQYNSQNGHLSYDSVHFATLQVNLNIDEQHFILV